MIFSWNQEEYALLRKDIVKVFNTKNLYATNWDILKLSSEDDKLFPVIDPLSMLSIDESVITKDSTVVILEDRGIDYGLLVDNIVGVRAFDSSDLEAPSIGDKRFVTNIVEGVKIIEPKEFLTQEIKHLFSGMNRFDEDSLVEMNKVFGGSWSDAASLKTDLKTKILNLLLITEKNLDTKYSSYVKEIHDIADEL